MPKPEHYKEPLQGDGPSVLLRRIDPVKEYGKDSEVPADTGLVVLEHVVRKTVEVILNGG